MRTRARTNSRRIVLKPRAETIRGFGMHRATQPIAVRLRGVSGVRPTALPTIPIRPRVQIIARRGLVPAPRATRVAAVLTHHRKEMHRPTIAGMRRSNLVRTPRPRLAVPIPRPRALTRLLAAAMVAVAALILAEVQLRTVVVAALPIAVAAVVTDTGKLHVFH